MTTLQCCLALQNWGSEPGEWGAYENPVMCGSVGLSQKRKIVGIPAPTTWRILVTRSSFSNRSMEIPNQAGMKPGGRSMMMAFGFSFLL